eukprot:m51a1_g5549 hypothetical protein (645) ;mRNA; r:524635-535945
MLMIDLVDFSSIKRHNNGIPFIMLAIDHFSKRLWTFPLRNKEPKLVVKCLEKKLFESTDPLLMAKARSGVGKQAKRMVAKTAPTARQGAEPEVGDQARVSLSWLDPQTAFVPSSPSKGNTTVLLVVWSRPHHERRGDRPAPLGVATATLSDSADREVAVVEVDLAPATATDWTPSWKAIEVVLPVDMRFFQVWSTQPSTFTVIQLRSIESILRHHPNACVCVYSEELPVWWFSELWYYGHNVRVGRPSPEMISQRIPVTAPWAGRIREWRKGRNWYAHYADWLRLALLYLYGGTYTDTDYVFLRELGSDGEPSTNTTCTNAGGAITGTPPWSVVDPAVISRHTGYNANDGFALNNAFLSFDKGNKFLVYALEHISRIYRSRCWDCHGPRTVTHIYKTRLAEILARSDPDLSVASAAEKRPSSARPRSAIKKVLCSVEYNGKKFRVTVPLRTVDAAIETICESTSADAASTVIETFDPELDDWFVFNSIDMLVDKGKVRILAKKGAGGGADSPLPQQPPPGQARRPEWRGAQRMSAPVEEQLALRDYLKFPPGYTPKNSCAKELLANSDVLGLVDVSQLIQSCTEFIDDLRFSDPEELKYVNADELFAIVAYTYDLGYAKPEDNLYFKINVDLRGRMVGPSASPG